MRRKIKRSNKNPKAHTLDEMKMQINQLSDGDHEEEREDDICIERSNMRKVIETEDEERLIY